MIHPRTHQTVAGVAQHYDELNDYYLKIWGEHVHHGLWLPGAVTSDQAVRRLTEVVADRSGIASGDRVCDVGCGYGATARLLARDYGAKVVGLTVSESQYAYACRQYANDDNPRYLLRDWLENDFPNDTFDVCISIESSEHMPDLPGFFKEVFRVLRAGGRVAICAWLAREQARPWEERFLLEPICREGRLRGLGTETEYADLLDETGFQDIAFEAYSKQVRRTWTICAWRMIKLAFSDREARRFWLAGPENRVFVKTVPRIWLAYRLGSMRYGLFTARKPG